MAKENEKIDWSLLTPEAAYKRVIEYADKMALSYPKPSYKNDGKTLYKFNWDKNSKYVFNGVNDLGGYHFIREDGKSAVLTKYSYLPWDIPEEL